MALTASASAARRLVQVAALAALLGTGTACVHTSQTPYDRYSAEVKHDPGYNPAGKMAPLGRTSADAVESLICSKEVQRVDRGLAVLEAEAGGEAGAIYHAGRILKAYCNETSSAEALILAVGQRYGRAMVYTIPQ
jgi:hypothetical protein